VGSSWHKRIKMLAAAIAGAFVAIGAALAVVVSQQQTGTTLMVGPMSIGQTATTTTAPPMEPTPAAAPTMKASRPRGF
jgi:hypothetical protein